MHTEAVGAEALLSGLLNRKLPGPGTSIAAQDLHFEGSVQTGDELTATVTAREKKPKGLVVFDCRVKTDGRELVTGTVTVRAPDHRLDLRGLRDPAGDSAKNRQICRVAQTCEKLPAVKCVVAHPCDRDSLLGPIEAAKLGLIELDPGWTRGENPRGGRSRRKSIFLLTELFDRTQPRLSRERPSHWCAPAKAKRS